MLLKKPEIFNENRDWIYGTKSSKKKDAGNLTITL
jgi:hypothetical protein